MPTIRPDIASTVNFDSLSPPTAKTLAFRPDTNELWALVSGIATDGSVHRIFYRSIGGAAFSSVTNWNPFNYTPVTSSKPYSAFAFRDDAKYLFCATVSEELEGGATSHYYLYVGFYNVSDENNTTYPPGTWYTLHEEEHTAAWHFVDLALSGSSSNDQYPMVVVGNDSQVRFYWRDSLYYWRNEQIQDGSYRPTGKASILNHNGQNVIIHATEDTSSYLYTFPMIAGAPEPPGFMEWSPTEASVDMPNAQIALGENGLGILTDQNSDLEFRIWPFDPGGLSDVETASSLNPNEFAYGLCFRGGQWHAVVAEGSTGDIVHRRRNNEGEWSTHAHYHTQSNWKHFGMTTILDNPPLWDENDFAVCVLDDGSFNYDAIIVDDWFTSIVQGGLNYWEYGNLLGSTLFGFSSDTGAVEKETSLTAFLRMIDVIEIEDHTVFSRGSNVTGWAEGNFFCYPAHFKDWYAPGTVGMYANKIFILTTGAVDYGSSYRKYARELIADLDIDEDQQVLITVISDTGTRILTVDYSNTGKPLRLNLAGRWFKVHIYESSTSDVGVRSLDLGVVWTGIKS